MVLGALGPGWDLYQGTERISIPYTRDLPGPSNDSGQLSVLQTKGAQGPQTHHGPNSGTFTVQVTPAMGWMVAPKRCVPILEPMTVTLFEKRVSADVNKRRISR